MVFFLLHFFAFCQGLIYVGIYNFLTKNQGAFCGDMSPIPITFFQKKSSKVNPKDDFTSQSNISAFILSINQIYLAIFSGE